MSAIRKNLRSRAETISAWRRQALHVRNSLFQSVLFKLCIEKLTIDSKAARRFCAIVGTLRKCALQQHFFQLGDCRIKFEIEQICTVSVDVVLDTLAGEVQHRLAIPRQAVVLTKADVQCAVLISAV